MAPNGAICTEDELRTRIDAGEWAGRMVRADGTWRVTDLAIGLTFELTPHEHSEHGTRWRGPDGGGLGRIPPSPRNAPVRGRVRDVRARDEDAEADPAADGADPPA